MRVILKKNQTVGTTEVPKGTEGWVWCCLIHNDSFLVNFKEIRIEVSRHELDFPTTAK